MEGGRRLLHQEEDGRLGAARGGATTRTGRSAPPGQQGGDEAGAAARREGVEAQGVGEGARARAAPPLGSLGCPPMGLSATPLGPVGQGPRPRTWQKR